jgi:hypothetical protein
MVGGFNALGGFCLSLCVMALIRVVNKAAAFQ